MATAGGGSGSSDVLYKDPHQPVEIRVQDLLSRMTLQEKVAQMAQIERAVVSPTALTELSIGSVLSSGGSAPQPCASALHWADMVDAMQRCALSSRLGIPIIYSTDAVHGHNNLLHATIFPHNVGLGATRDGELARRIGVATALEVRATGIHCTFAPCVAVSHCFLQASCHAVPNSVNIACGQAVVIQKLLVIICRIVQDDQLRICSRMCPDLLQVCQDPRWGRCYESYSEDTKIVRDMTTIVSGLQGSPPKDHLPGYPFIVGSKNVIACAKHFVGDGGTHRGINEGNTNCSFEELEKIHIMPYRDCLDQGVCTIMASYSSWNDRALHSDRYLLTDILKGKLGFKGFLISDWEGIDRLTWPHWSNYRYCISASVNAGIDMIMVPHRYERFLEDIVYLVESGEIPMSRIDDAVERILRVKFVAGLFEQPFSDRSLTSIVRCKV
ncbi:Beta-D-xylosidase 1 [Dendrobium catenatum]|uniref:Beta-D-xylosidase 1 n=1 Tax=Dendrobium catenatum TaxID=906689 RepID=A0A2I0VW07_9ASPA|nr:Beta-D-xylosidase 1 [Dendrobium catenatum]